MPRLSTFADVVTPALNAFQAGQKVREDHRKQQTLAEIGQRLQAGATPRELAPVALQAGDREGFTKLSNLANQNRNFAHRKQRASVADKRAATQAAESKRRFDVTTGLQRDRLNASVAESRANRSRAERSLKIAEAKAKKLTDPQDIIATRAAAAERVGLEKGTPEYQGYVLTGKLPKPTSSRAAKTTVDNAKASGFARRAIASDKIINDPKSVQAAQSVLQRATAAVPIIGNFFVDPSFQKFDQAQRDFINAQLRRESGAVISDAEFDNAEKQYFVQPGDSPEVIQQKAANRQNAIAGLVESAGPLGDQFQGQSAQPTPQIQEGQTATNPQTGEKIVFQGGQWVPAQ